MSNTDRSSRLLFKSENGVAPGVLVIGGVRWRFGDWRDTPPEAEALAYTCVSYAWGDTCVPNPLVLLNQHSKFIKPGAAKSLTRSAPPSGSALRIRCFPPPAR